MVHPAEAYHFTGNARSFEIQTNRSWCISPASKSETSKEKCLSVGKCNFDATASRFANYRVNVRYKPGWGTMLCACYAVSNTRGEFTGNLDKHPSSKWGVEIARGLPLLCGSIRLAIKVAGWRSSKLFERKLGRNLIFVFSMRWRQRKLTKRYSVDFPSIILHGLYDTRLSTFVMKRDVSRRDH